jgi:hypothetical protein
MSKDDQKKLVIHQIDSLNKSLESQVDEYCKCLETGTVKDCQPIYEKICVTYDSASRKTENALMGNIITTEDNEKLHGKTASLFDKKAACAKAAMKKEQEKENK